MDEQELFEQSFYRTLEDSIANLPQAARGDLYRPCAESCVKRHVLGEMQRQFDECDGSLDLQFTRYGRSDYFFADVIEPGHVYELGYPRCLCPVVEAGFTNAAEHCECSRQSIIYVLETLLPGERISVETLHTVLSGADECRFRVKR